MNATEVEITEDEHEEMLNDSFGEVEICGMMFGQGTALRGLDPIAFNCSISDEPTRYECGLCSETHDDIDAAADCCKVECESCGDLHETDGGAENCCEEE